MIMQVVEVFVLLSLWPLTCWLALCCSMFLKSLEASCESVADIAMCFLNHVSCLVAVFCWIICTLRCICADIVMHVLADAVGWLVGWLVTRFSLAKMSSISRTEIWRTLRKMGCYWAEEYTTSQLHRCSCTELNKFLLAYVTLFKCVYFRQYFACLCERIFNCCSVLLSS